MRGRKISKSWHGAWVDEGQEDNALRVPDTELDFGAELVMHYQGRPFTGIAYETMNDGTHSELTYVGGLQEGPAREWDPSGRLRAEEAWHANFRHGLSRTYDKTGAVISEQWFDHGMRVDAPPA